MFAGMIQTESPYFQPTPPPPAPFTEAINAMPGDPEYRCDGNQFSGCDQSWAVIIRGSEYITIASAGLYSWFSTYQQSCVDQQLCQKVLMLIEKNTASIRVQNLITIGAEYMAVVDGKGLPARDNINVDAHPFWSLVSVLDVAGNSTGLDGMPVLQVDPKIWDMDQPSFTCSPPCKVQLPPWSRATSTVDYPLLTVSKDSWTSTITQAPITISVWYFEVVTLIAAPTAKLKRQNQSPRPFWPTFATFPNWPSAVFLGPDGSPTTTAPSQAFPTPPATIGSNMAAAPTGSWPKRAIDPFFAEFDSPMVLPCSFANFKCFEGDWSLYNANGTLKDPLSLGGNIEDFYEENLDELATTCPPPSSSSSSSTTTTTSSISTIQDDPPPPPKESPQEGDPLQNNVKCYGGGGQRTERVRIVNTVRDFCQGLGRSGTVLGSGTFREQTFTLPQSSGLGVKILTSLRIKDKCQWTWNQNECERYMKITADSCNCKGENGKQGGMVSNDCYEWRVDPNTNWG